MSNAKSIVTKRMLLAGESYMVAFTWYRMQLSNKHAERELIKLNNILNSGAK